MVELNLLFLLWSLHIGINIFILFTKKKIGFRPGCFIIFAFFLLHFLNGILITPKLVSFLNSAEENQTDYFSQSPGFLNPVVIVFLGNLVSVVIQIVFNRISSSRQPPGMPTTYEQEK
jgi:hypothetical protein